MGRITQKITHSEFEKTKFDALSVIHALQEGDGFIVATLHDDDNGHIKIKSHCGVTRYTARMLFLSLFGNPAVRQEASLVLSILEVMGIEKAQDFLEQISSAEEDTE